MGIMARIDPMQQSRPDRAGEEAVTASELLAVLARRWLAIALCLGLTLAAALAYLVVTTPRYRASASLLLDPRGGAALSTPDLVAGRLSQDVNLIESQVRLVASPAVLARVVASQHLVDDPEFNQAKGVSGGLRSLIGLASPPSEAAPREQQALANFAEHVDVKRSERTLILDIEVTSRDPAKAARLADAVAAAFVEDQLAAKARATGSESGRLDGRLRELAAGIRAGEQRIEAFKAKNRILDVASAPTQSGPNGTMDEQQLTELNSAVVRARAQLADARARLAGIEHAGPTGAQLDALPESLRSGVIASLRTQQAEAQKRIDNLGMHLGPRHPDLLEARQQLRGVAVLIGDELKRIAAAVRNDVAVAAANEAASVRALEGKKRDLTGTNAARVELRALERTVLADKATYDRLLAADSTLQQEGATTPIARPLAPALLPLRPASPNTRAILLIAAVLGLALGLAAALLIEHRARRRRVLAPVESRSLRPSEPQSTRLPDDYLGRFHQYGHPAEAGE